MGLRNTPTEYGSVAKFFHWVILILIFIMIPIGLVWSTIGSTNDTLINVHKLMGLLILVLLILRLLWALINPWPKIAESILYERIIDYLMYGTLYLFMLIMPLTGWYMTTASGKPPHLFNILLPMPGIALSPKFAAIILELHGILAGVFVALLVMHILTKIKNGCRWG